MKEQQQKKYYVYVLCDPRKTGKFRYEGCHFDHEPFYVGKGTGRRARSHLQGVQAGKDFSNPHKANKIRRILECGLLPIILTAERKDEKHAFETEKKLVAAIGRGPKGPLTNLTAGGEGFSAPIRSAERKRKRNWQRAMDARTEKQREETRRKNSEAAKNRDPEVTKKIAEALRGKAKPKAWYEQLLARVQSKKYKREQSERMKASVERRRKAGTLKTGPRGPLSEETKAKLAEAARKRWAKPSFKRKMASHMERMHAKAAKSARGRVFSEDTRKKISDARKQYWKEWRMSHGTAA